MEKREHFYTVGGIINWCSYCGKHYGDASKKLRMELLYDLAIPLLGIYPKNTKILI